MAYRLFFPSLETYKRETIYYPSATMNMSAFANIESRRRQNQLPGSRLWHLTLTPIVRWLGTVLLCLFLSGCGTTPSGEVALYVSPTGSDSNPGIEESPFLTIDRARDAVRSLNQDMAGDIVVYLRGGVYPVKDTLRFGSRDSGSNGFNVVYRNYPGEAPVISGGEMLTGWTDLGNGLHAAPYTGDEFVQMYVNNSMATRARYPDSGSEFRLLGHDVEQDRIELEKDQAMPWLGLDRMQIVFPMGFTLARIRIEDILFGDDRDIVVPREPERTSLGVVSPGTRGGKPSYYFENHFSFLDQPGEWFLDIDKKVVYYKNRAGEDMSTAVIWAPVTERLWEVSGTRGDPVRNFIVFGLTFQHASWNAPVTEGMVQRQAGMHYRNGKVFVTNPAAVYYNYVEDSRIERNIFRQLGGNALEFDLGTRNNIIRGNVFAEIADTGIEYDSNDDPSLDQNPLDVSENDRITNNYFFRMGTVYYGGAGMFAFWPRNLYFAHNHISQTGGLGLNIGWNARSETSVFQGCVLEHNRIHDVAMWTNDSGGIHTKSNSSGLRIYQNWIYNAYVRDNWHPGPGRHIAGVYLDDRSENYTVDSNVIENYKHESVKMGFSSQRITMKNNDGRSQETMDHSGLEPGYRDIRQYWRGGAIGGHFSHAEPPAPTPTPPPLPLLYAEANPVTAFTGTPGEEGLSLSRPIPSSTRVIEFDLKANKAGLPVEFHVRDSNGRRLVQLEYDADAAIRAWYLDAVSFVLRPVKTSDWYHNRIELDYERKTFSYYLDGKLQLDDSLIQDFWAGPPAELTITTMGGPDSARLTNLQIRGAR
jgi:hypothetical protein